MDEIDKLLTRGVDQIYPSRQELEKLIRSGKKLRLYQGFDPTGSQLHIGHAVAIRKLRQFQDLGHEVIFLIGDFTAMIGDPTGKPESRKMLSREEVINNTKEYKNQASKILRFSGPNPAKILYNNAWLGKMSAFEFLKLANLFTVQQVVERDMFHERMKKDQDVFMNEFLYPLLQAYDSVAMDVDLEIGGTDQMFNMLMGRKLMKKIKQKEKFVLTVPLLTDSFGRKIGKTEGNVIGLNDPPSDFYAKIMALGDEAIIPCFTLLTDTNGEDIEEIKLAMERGENPMTFKKRLSFELTRALHSEADAIKAQEMFELTFQKRDAGQADIPELSASVTKDAPALVDALVLIEAAESKSEARRLIDQGAVELNDKRLTREDKPKFSAGDILKVGKKKFYRFVD